MAICFEYVYIIMRNWVHIEKYTSRPIETEPKARFFISRNVWECARCSGVFFFPSWLTGLCVLAFLMCIWDRVRESFYLVHTFPSVSTTQAWRNSHPLPSKHMASTLKVAVVRRLCPQLQAARARLRCLHPTPHLLLSTWIPTLPPSSLGHQAWYGWFARCNLAFSEYRAL